MKIADVSVSVHRFHTTLPVIGKTGPSETRVICRIKTDEGALGGRHEGARERAPSLRNMHRPKHGSRRHRRYAEHDALDIFMPNSLYNGGMSGTARVAALAHATSVRFRTRAATGSTASIT